MAAEVKRNRTSQSVNLTGSSSGSSETVSSLPAQDDRRPPDAPAVPGAPPVAGTSARQSIVSKPVSVSPLATLLPKLGSPKDLERVLDLLSERLEDLRQDPSPVNEEALRNRLLEEEMLIQVIGWATGERQPIAGKA